MMESAKQLACKNVNPTWHKGIIWLLVLALPLMLSLIAPAQQNHEAILGAIVLHDTPTIVTDDKGFITYANMPAMLELGCNKASDIYGRNITSWMRPATGANHHQYFKEEDRMPLGSERPMNDFLVVDGKEKEVNVDVTPDVVCGSRIYMIRFRRPEQ